MTCADDAGDIGDLDPRQIMIRTTFTMQEDDDQWVDVDNDVETPMGDVSSDNPDEEHDKDEMMV